MAKSKSTGADADYLKMYRNLKFGPFGPIWFHSKNINISKLAILQWWYFLLLLLQLKFYLINKNILISHLSESKTLLCRIFLFLSPIQSIDFRGVVLWCRYIRKLMQLKQRESPAVTHLNHRNAKPTTIRTSS